MVKHVLSVQATLVCRLDTCSHQKYQSINQSVNHMSILVYRGEIKLSLSFLIYMIHTVHTIKMT